MNEPSSRARSACGLPRPRPLASALLRWSHGADAHALEGDLAEAYQLRRAEGAVRAWVWAWAQVMSSAVHGLGSGGRPRGGGRLRPVLGLRLAVRGLVRDPVPSLLAVAILALGMAAPTTFASLLWGAVRPLPVPEGEQVLGVEVVQPARDGRAVPVTGEDLEAWRGAAALSAIGGFEVRSATLEDPGLASTRVSFAAVTGDVLPLLQVAPLVGRIPAAAEVEPTLLLGHRLWVEVFGADPGILGRTVKLGGVARTVAAVMPAGFAFPFQQEAWVVLSDGEARSLSLEPVGRLARGASFEAATRELAQRWARRDGTREPEMAGGVVRARPFTRGWGEGGEAVAFLGLVLVGLCLLVIACANVANLLLVRAVRRVRSLGVQAALGAGRVQLGMQLLLEAVLLAAAGGLGGLLLARFMVGWVQAVGHTNFGYYWMRMAVDGPVLPGVAGLVLFTALAAGALPAARVMRTDLRTVLGNGGAAGARSGQGWSRAFVTTQLALSCGALVAAGLTGRALLQAGDWGRGVPADEVLVARVHLPDGSGPTALAELERALNESEGVRGAALALGAPGAWEVLGPLELAGESYERPGDREGVMANAVTPGFFDALDMDLVRGRGILASDGAGAARVAVVNQAFVERFFREGDPLGRLVRVPQVDSAWVTVVGVVETVDLGGGAETRLDRVYLSLHQVGAASAVSILRGEAGVGGLPGPLRMAVAAVDPAIAVNEVQSLADLHRFMVRAQATLATLAVTGGLAGLLVAAVGLYGVLAVGVRQRRRELGVRLALGADGRRLAREVVESAVRQLLPALAFGLAAAWLAGPFIAILLLGGDARDPVVFGGVAVTFLAVGCGAALGPALRAAATDPADALRTE